VHDVDTLINILDGRSGLLLIQRLPEKYQKIMRMRFTENMSLEEMSIATGQTKNALSVQIHRGLQKLRSAVTNTLRMLNSACEHGACFCYPERFVFSIFRFLYPINKVSTSSGRGLSIRL